MILKSLVHRIRSGTPNNALLYKNKKIDESNPRYAVLLKNLHWTNYLKIPVCIVCRARYEINTNTLSTIIRHNCSRRQPRSSSSQLAVTQYKNEPIRSINLSRLFAPFPVCLSLRISIDGNLYNIYEKCSWRWHSSNNCSVRRLFNFCSHKI